MSDNGFLKNDQLKSVLSRIKTRVESGIANAISDSASTLNSSISSGDASTLSSAKSYTDTKTQNKFELEDLTNSPVDVGDIIIANDQAGLKGKSSGVKLSNLANFD